MSIEISKLWEQWDAVRLEMAREKNKDLFYVTVFRCQEH